MIEILSTGLSNSVQDLGRFGYLDAGVSRSGAMDAPALELANLLIANAPAAAGLEITVFPFRLRFLKRCRFAVAGAECETRLGHVRLPNFWAGLAKEGDELRLSPPTDEARAYIAFEGGLDVAPVLGSRSTDLKSGWGGLEGRGLSRGDRLAFLQARSIPAFPQAGFGIDPPAWRQSEDRTAVRVLPGAEWVDFGRTAQTQFLETAWTLSGEANRQGYRFDGPRLEPERRRELFSHGIMPGTVQVPPNGLPIIQMAEANTCGGYAKIAQVIEADLWKLGQMRPGDDLTFRPVTRTEAIEALRQARALMDGIAADVRLLTRDWLT